MRGDYQAVIRRERPLNDQTLAQYERPVGFELSISAEHDEEAIVQLVFRLDAASVCDAAIFECAKDLSL